MSPLRPILAVLVFTCVSLASLAAQQDSKVQIRLVAERLPKGLGKVVLAAGEERTQPFILPMNNLSVPKEVPGRVFQLLAPEQQMVLAKVTLPAQGKDFVVLLIPAGEKAYSPVVIPHKHADFKAGDIYLHNNARDPVVGMVGDGRFSVDPGKGTFFRPTFKDDNKRYHDVGIGVKFESGDKVISTTRWPKSTNTRYYVFFYVNPRTQRVNYRAVDEFLEPEPAAN